MSKKPPKIKNIFILILILASIAALSGIAASLYPEFNFAAQSASFYLRLCVSPLALALSFYALFRYQMRAVNNLEGELKKYTGSKDLDFTIESSGILSDFTNILNQFLEASRAKCNTLEGQKNDLFTTNKVLEYKKRRLEAILEQLQFGIMLLDESNSVIFVNCCAEKFLGIKKEDVMGNEMQDWCKNEEISSFLSRYQGKNHNRLHRTEAMEIRPKYLTDTTILLTAYPLGLPDDDSSAFGALVICRDITSEVMIKKTYEEFVVHISHELKSPLNVLRMYSEMLLGDSGKSEEFRVEAVNVIYDEVERLALLINNLLSISKLEMGSMTIERQRIKPVDLLKDVFDSATRSGKGEKLNFHLDLPDELSPIAVDKEMLRVALNNLITNAIKYNRNGGSVTLSAEETPEQIIIRVRDTGIGIDKKDIENIYKKFYRSENEEVRKRPGHGLGLALAKSIIDLHRGKIEVKSELGRGTEFAVIFDKTGGLIREGL